MLGTIIIDTIRKLTPEQHKPLAIEDVYPVLRGQRKRNEERMNAIKVEMGTKYILHPSHTKKKLKKARPV